MALQPNSSSPQVSGNQRPPTAAPNHPKTEMYLPTAPVPREPCGGEEGTSGHVHCPQEKDKRLRLINPPAPQRRQPLPSDAAAGGGTAFWTRFFFSWKKEKKIRSQHTTPEPFPLPSGRNSGPPKPICFLASMISLFPSFFVPPLIYETRGDDLFLFITYFEADSSCFNNILVSVKSNVSTCFHGV